MLINLEFDPDTFKADPDNEYWQAVRPDVSDDGDIIWYVTGEFGGDGEDAEIVACGFVKIQDGVYTALSETLYFATVYPGYSPYIEDFAMKHLGVNSKDVSRWLLHECPMRSTGYGTADNIQQILDHPPHQWFLECEHPVVLIANSYTLDGSQEFDGPYLGTRSSWADNETVIHYHFYILGKA